MKRSNNQTERIEQSGRAVKFFTSIYQLTQGKNQISRGKERKKEKKEEKSEDRD